MTKVHYFQRYSQAENFVTNSTLHLLYRFYNFNRRRFQTLFARILDEQAETPLGDVGMRINQQVGTGSSVLDGFLYQPAVRIGIETKRAASAFDANQLVNHLSAFKAEEAGYLVLLSPQKANLSSVKFRSFVEEAKKRNIWPVSVTFEELIEGARKCLQDFDEEMHELVDDFEEFCSFEQLLDTDRVTMFVPPCGQSFDINVKFDLYFCPAAWSRRNVRFIGIYKEKAVRYVGQITNVVIAELKSGQINYAEESEKKRTLAADEESRIKKAISEAKRQNGWDISFGHKFFLCDRLYETDYKKASSGGIRGHKYLSIRDYIDDSSSAEFLAKKLQGAIWQ